MKLSILGRLAFGVIASGVMLAGCNANSAGTGGPPVTALSKPATNQQTFSYTGAEQTFQVPTGVTSISIVADGAAGGGFTNGVTPARKTKAGLGGRTDAAISVTPGETLYVFVGGEGTSGSGGFNGGGGVPSTGGYGGGGASDVRAGGNGLGDRVLVAGGGGGYGSGGAVGGGCSGCGGGTTGKKGTGPKKPGSRGGGGGGGTQNAGGSGGTAGYPYGHPGSPGALGSGGTGGQNDGALLNSNGGGGGGGYYGGGGGGGGGDLSMGARYQAAVAAADRPTSSRARRALTVPRLAD